MLRLLHPYQDRPARYGREAEEAGLTRCEEAVVAMLRGLLDQRLAGRGHENLLDAGATPAWWPTPRPITGPTTAAGTRAGNLRDRHMAQVLADLLDTDGPDACDVVWAYNSHVGDARATGMG